MSTDLESTLLDAGAEDELLTSDGCVQCGEPGEDLENSWCRHCGFYAKYGTTIDLDQRWEAQQEDDGESPPMPAWVYRLAGIWFGLFAFSLISRLAELAGQPLVHLIVGLSQVLLGCGVFMTVHLMCFLQRSLADGGLKLMDLLGPFTIWGPVFREMPKTERRVTIAWTGLWSAVFGAVITGGIPTSWMEFKETVIAGKEEPPGGGGGPPAAAGSGNLTDAVEEFANQGTRMVGMPGDEPAAPAEDEDEERREVMECVIIGYLPAASSSPAGGKDSVDNSEAFEDESSEGETSESETSKGKRDHPTPDGAADELPLVGSLIVASQVGRQLCVVGYVNEGLTPDLLPRLKPHLRDRPCVPCSASGVWVEPRVICRIRYQRWDAAAGLIRPKFDGILHELQ